MRIAAFVALAVLLSTDCCAWAAGKTISGTYTNANGCIVEFRASGKVYLSGCYGGMTAYEYEVDGDRIIVHESGGGVVYKMLPNGTIRGGGMEGLLHKKS